MSMRTLNLRQAILERVQNKSHEELMDVIEASIDHDERTLPGLGVLFEIIWKHIDQQQQQQLAAVLSDNLRTNEQT